ncbi:hypothetical protein ACP4OV_016059 [Aristida adscensionis]
MASSWSWDTLVDAALAILASRRTLLHTRLIELAPTEVSAGMFAGPGPWHRATVEIQLDRASLNHWLTIMSLREDELSGMKLILFSGNDYMCLSSHPAVREAAVKAAQAYGMGPRGSSLICGYTTYHKLVEESLAKLQKKEDCLLCPSGFSANTAVMTALGSLSSLSAAGRKPAEEERIAIFSDALNHASTINGIHLVERTQAAVAYVYKHRDMSHLELLLSSCSMEKKVVVTDSLFSMDGDFAPLPELVKLRNKYGFLLVVDDAHGTFVCGENGGGVPELFACENGIDIVVGSLSKGPGCLGGFIACSTRWKSTAIDVSKKETWRRSLIWGHVRYFASLTKLDVTSPIILIVVGSEEVVLKAASHLLRSGFLVEPIRPPVVPPRSCITPWLPVKQVEKSLATTSK